MFKGRESLLEKKMNTALFIEAIALVALVVSATLVSVALLLCDEEQFEVKAEMIGAVSIMTAMITALVLSIGGFIVM